MNILYKEKPEYIALLTIILVVFDKYNRPILINIEGIPVIPIVPI